MRGQLEELNEKIEKIKSDVEDIHNEATEAVDSKSDSWQDSEKGESEREKVEALFNAAEYIDSAWQSLQDAIADLVNATEENE